MFQIPRPSYPFLVATKLPPRSLYDPNQTTCANDLSKPRHAKTRYEAAKEMTRHFFQVDGLTARQDERLRSIFDDRLPSAGDGVGGGGVNEAGYAAGRTITPAVVEQLAGEFDYVDDFIAALAAV